MEPWRAALPAASRPESLRSAFAASISLHILFAAVLFQHAGRHPNVVPPQILDIRLVLLSAHHPLYAICRILDKSVRP